MVHIVSTIVDDSLIEASSFTITANEPIDILTSDPVVNAMGFDSMRLTVKFEDLTPGNVLSFYLMVEVDFKDQNGKWQLLPVYQINPLRKADQAPNRTFILSPNINSNPGEPDIQERAGIKLAEIQRFQGSLPSADIRARLVLVDPDPLGANAFVSVKVTGEVDLYSV